MRLSLFWRTFLLIATVVVVSLLAWLQLFRAAEIQPRAERLASEIASIVNLTRAGLINAAGPARIELLGQLARDEGIRVLPAESEDRLRSWPDERFGLPLEDKLKERLGPETRIAATVNDESGLWVRFLIDEDPYWIVLDPVRITRQANRNWLGWIGIAVMLAGLGGLIISRVVNRPLSDLARAISALGQGQAPQALPDDAPTEISEVNRAFNRMARDLVALEQDRAEALAGVSHDIRTPLTRLRMEIELSGLDASSLSSMADEIDRIDAIVRQFVEFAQPETSQPASRIEVGPVVSSVVDGFRQGAAGAGLRIMLDVPEDLNWWGSNTTLVRILTNLIENARRYGISPDGLAHVEVMARRDKRGLTLIVRDHGPGVPESELERLTRPFTRLDEERNRQGGSGLGLAIVTRLARRFGGELRLERPSDGGLAARVSLPDATH